MVIRGMRNREIATSLNTTESGVKLSLNRIYQKLGVRSRYELALAARSAGLTPRENLRVPGTARPEFDAEWMFGCSERV